MIIILGIMLGILHMIYKFNDTHVPYRQYDIVFIPYCTYFRIPSRSCLRRKCKLPWRKAFLRKTKLLLSLKNSKNTNFWQRRWPPSETFAQFWKMKALWVIISTIDVCDWTDGYFRMLFVYLLVKMIVQCQRCMNDGRKIVGINVVILQ